jgi:Uncharacterized protein, putative amidase
MRYELMRPEDIRASIARGLPAVLPVGVMEYHGEHLPVGMDLLAVTRALDRLAAERAIVLLPAFAMARPAMPSPRPRAPARCMSMPRRWCRCSRRCSRGCCGWAFATCTR